LTDLETSTTSATSYDWLDVYSTCFNECRKWPSLVRFGEVLHVRIQNLGLLIAVPGDNTLNCQT
jgi:hypothetical protein